MTPFSIPSFAALRPLTQGIDVTHARRALAMRPFDLGGLGTLLSPAGGEILPELAARSRELTLQRFGRTIQMYAPLYLANYCVNRCAYCGFSAENRIERRRLSVSEVEAEAGVLASQGFDHILLVAGEAPRRYGMGELLAVAAVLKGRFASVAIEVQPLTAAEYRQLFEAGVTAVTVYQETYDRLVYDAVHLDGPKRDFDARLDTPARVAAAGMREVGIGALLGLSDWRLEGLALGMHLAWLRRNFWRTGVTVSFPRLRPAEGDFKPLSPVGEENLAQLVFALRIFDPDVGLVLSTREEARFRDGMAGLGPTRYSAGSCTVPGGYSRPELSGAQFTIGDHRGLDEVCAAIRAKSLDPVRKDWDPVFQAVAA